jgi:hypothetical protein
MHLCGPEFKTSRRAAETQSFLMTAVGTYGLLRLDSALWQEEGWTSVVRSLADR